MLNSHCYVICSEHGLVRLWVVGGLSMVISRALCVSQSPWLLYRTHSSMAASAGPACLCDPSYPESVLLHKINIITNISLDVRVEVLNCEFLDLIFCGWMSDASAGHCFNRKIVF